MKLKTSFFNPTVLKKNVTRFAPLWGLYTVFMLITLFLIFANESEPAQFATIAPDITRCMGIVNIVYAGLCALLLFGDLFTSKMAGMLHAMPMRREGWFLTHVASGMLFCLVPNALGAVLACMILQKYCYLAFIWLAVMILQFTFFFGVGVFSAQCAGNKLGAAAVYALINFLAVLVGFLVVTFYEPVLYGVVIDPEGMFRGSPVVEFTLSSYMEVVRDHQTGGVRFEGFDPGAWRYLWICFALGLAFLGSAVVLYRRRQLESAGDFMSFRPAAPVFLVLYTLSVGAVLYLFAEVFGSDLEYLFLIVGFAIGFFTGHMLLEKKVGVFGLKKWMGFGLLVAAFFLTITVVTIDPFGVTRYVPSAGKVVQVMISPHSGNYYMSYESSVLSDPQDIQKVIDIHKSAVGDSYYADERDSGQIRIRYYLKDGRTVERQYNLPLGSAAAESANQLFSDFEYLTGGESVEKLMEKLDVLEFSSHDNELANIGFGDEFTPEKYGNDRWITIDSGEDLRKSQMVKGLLEALKADCDAGHTNPNWGYHSCDESVGTLILQRKGVYTYDYRDITIFACCENTIAYLKTLTAQAEQSEQTPDAEDMVAGNMPETIATEPRLVS